METNDLLLLADYLAGTLAESEQQDVEQRLAQDASFAQLHQQQEAQQHILRASARAEEKKILQRQLDSVRREQANTRRLWTGMAIAAAIACLILVYVAPWQSEAVLPEQLAMGYLEPFSADMARAEGESTPLSVALQAYQNEQYAEALPLLTSLLAEEPENELLQLYRGECLSFLGEYASAAQQFAPLAESSSVADAAQWRLALNLLLAGQQEKALPWLVLIRQGPHYRQQEATVLLQKMGEQ